MAKITRDEAKKQVKRLLSSPMLAPQSKEGGEEIMDCLLRHCKSPDHAERAMTLFLDTARDPRNLTAELSAAAMATRQEAVLPDGCDLCAYTDFETKARHYRPHVTATVKGYDVARRCTCKRGEYLFASDLRRAAEAAVETRPVVAAMTSAKDLAAGERA